jgi:hypothetical protein
MVTLFETFNFNKLSTEFVINLHYASLRHFDIRIKNGNILESWATQKLENLLNFDVPKSLMNKEYEFLSKQNEEDKKKEIEKKSIKKCKYCEKEYKNGQSKAGHQTFCKMNPNRDLTGNKISDSNRGRKHTEETKKIISEKLSNNNKGGRCKWFDFLKSNGEIVRVQGTWELRFAKVLEILDSEWIKPNSKNKGHSFKWKDDEGKIHTYTPDFYSKKLKKYFEVKGFWWNNDKRKMESVINQNPELNIEIIFNDDLKNYENLI